MNKIFEICLDTHVVFVFPIDCRNVLARSDADQVIDDSMMNSVFLPINLRFRQALQRRIVIIQRCTVKDNGKESVIGLQFRQLDECIHGKGSAQRMTCNHPRLGKSEGIDNGNGMLCRLPMFKILAKHF